MSRLALLILIVGVIHRANAATKACTYTWVTPTSVAGTAAGTYTVSIGAPLAMSITVDNDVENDDTNIWKSGTDTLSSVTAASGTFAGDTDGTSGVITTFTAAVSGAHSYTMAFPSTGVPEAQNGKVITLTNSGCTAASNGITLTVTSCNLAAYGDQASAAVTTACDYNCQREFTCTHDTTAKFTATCQADASWSQKYAPCPCAASAGVKEVALLALVMLCSSLSATHLM